MSDFKKCPNQKCEGSWAHLDVTTVFGRRDWGAIVECFWCGMRGPGAPTVPEAKEAWNDLPRGAT